MLSNRPKRNLEFGRLLSGAINSIATYEGKNAPIVEQEIGELINLTVASVQRYKSGHLPPEPRTIEKIADAGVKRGYLDRRWLAKFLNAAEYPSPNILLDRLCPQTLVQMASPERVLQNLPAPNYTHFVMRLTPFQEITAALQTRTALVVLSSLGGMGKTSLAREVAGRCLEHQGEAPSFDAIVWLTDADRPGYTTLSSVLDEIAHTLGYSPFASLAHEEKKREVDQLLRRRRVLVILDNFETVTDSQLLRWLLNLPEPSKALITTREWRREFRQGACHVELRGMSDTECSEFIRQRLAQLGLDRFTQDLNQFEPLVSVTGGNPKAIVMSLGCLKYEHRPLQDVVDDLYAARSELFSDLVQRSWALLDEASRRVLLAATLFNASIDRDALSATADVRGQTFARAIERLDDLAFIDVQSNSLQSQHRYSLHPLVRTFASSEMAKDPAFEEAARNRRLQWYMELVARVGYCRNELNRLKLLDPEQAMLHVVTAWAQDQKRYADTFALVNGCAFFCYVRGLEHKEPNLNLAGADSARALGRPIDEIVWLAHYIQRASRAGQVTEATMHLVRLKELASANPGALTGETGETYAHALATFYLATGNIIQAGDTWQHLLADGSISPNTQLIASRWLAECMLRQGDHLAAYELVRAMLGAARPDANQRAIIALQLQMARLCLALDDVKTARDYLETARAKVQHDAVDRHLPDVLYLDGLFMMKNGDGDRARTALEAALDGYQRRGLNFEIIETRRVLQSLNVKG
ncbi:MAG TPA: NB-ARC domain-containing protein [Anaerolineae bacterium]